LNRGTAELLPVAHTSGERRFLRPLTLAEAVALLQTYPDATLIAGGTDLMVYANQRYRRYSTLIALDALPELKRFDWHGDEVVIGAALPLSALEERLAQHDLSGELGLLTQLLPLFSSRLIRNRATLGGNLLTASPIGDSLPVLLALDAELTLAGAAGTRKVALREFFRGYRQTAANAGEIAVSVHIERPMPQVQRFYKASKRVLDDISTVAAAFGLSLDAAGHVERLRLAYGGVAATPIRALAAEEAAHGKPWNRATRSLVLEKLAGIGTPQDDQRGSAAYRQQLISTLFERFCAESGELDEAAQ
jgi:xanthine dehydrogenase small subunit